MRPVLLLLTATLCLTSCGIVRNYGTKLSQIKQKRDQEKLSKTAVQKATEKYGTKVIGEVTYVDAQNAFILIKPLHGAILNTGMLLECRDGKKGPVRGTVEVSPERKSGFVAADIKSGQPVAGDFTAPTTGKKKAEPRLIPKPANGQDPNSPANASPGEGSPAGTIHLDGDATPEQLLRPGLIPDLPIEQLDPLLDAPPPIPETEVR